MHNSASQPEYFPDTMLDHLNIQLLGIFKKYNAKGNNLFCSYMSVGQKYENELLVIGRETSYWPEDFSVEELNRRGEVEIFRTKVHYHANFGLDSTCPMKYVTDLWGNTKKRKKYNTSYNTLYDPFWGCTKEILMKLDICKNKTNWSSHIAHTNLYKIAYSNSRYLPEKPRRMQFEYCKEFFELELSILRPKRILFLTGMKYAQDFLQLSDCSGLEDCVCPLGEFDFGFHKAQIVVSVHPKKYKREILVRHIVKAFGH